MVVPKILREVKLVNVDEGVLQGLLSFLGVDTSSDLLQSIISIKNALVKDNPSVKVADLLNDKEFVSFVQSIGLNYLKSSANRKVESGKRDDTVVITYGSLVKCPSCECVAPIERFAPKAFNK